MKLVLYAPFRIDYGQTFTWSTTDAFAMLFDSIHPSSRQDSMSGLRTRKDDGIGKVEEYF